MKKTKDRIINYTNGDKYSGEIKNNKKHGFGTFIWKDGSQFFGDWENDKKHGVGTFIDVNGEILSALWKKGKFVHQSYRRADKKINLEYLKKNLNLKRFIKILDKQKQSWGNDRVIYYDFLKSCSDKKNDYNVLFNEINWHNQKLYRKFEDYFITGQFLPFISENFKLEKVFEIIGPKLTDIKQESYTHQIVSSKINKCFYVLVYQGFDYSNDGYYCREKFKDKKSALNFIKKEQKILKSKMIEDSK